MTAFLWTIFFISSTCSANLLFRFLWAILVDYGSGNHGTSFALFTSQYPFYLTTVTMIYLFFVVYFLLYPKTKTRKRINFIANGSIIALLGAANIVAIVLKLLSGEYYFFMDSFTSVYESHPLDLLIYSGLYILLGLFFIIYGSHFYIPWSDDRPNVELKGVLPYRILKKILAGFFFLVAMYYFGAFIYGFATYDKTNRYLFGLIPVFVLMFLPFLAFLAYFVLYNDFFIPSYQRRDIREERKIQLKYSLIYLVITLIVDAWIVIYEKSHPNYITESMTALFPVDHMLMGSLPLGVLIPSALMIITCLMSLLHNVIRRIRDC